MTEVDGGVLARLRGLSRRMGELFAQSVGSAARAGRAAGRALVPDPPAAGTVVERLEALAARLARLEGGPGGAPVGARVESVDRLIREAAGMTRDLIGRAAVHPLPPLDAMQPVGRVARQVLAALETQTRQPSPRVARAVIGLAHPRPEIRRLALEHLGTPPEPVVLPLLETLYEHTAGAERRALLAVARHMETGGRTSPLVREALADADAAVRLSAVRSVAAGAKLPEELDELATRDPRPEVRRASLQALVAGEATRRGVRVEQGLRDHDARVRLDTIQAAAATRDPAVVLPLVRALLDADGAVRRAAATAVTRLTGLEAGDPDAPAARRREVVSRLRRQWGHARFGHLGGTDGVERDAEPPLGEDELLQPLDAEYLVEPPSGDRHAGAG